MIPLGGTFQNLPMEEKINDLRRFGINFEEVFDIEHVNRGKSLLMQCKS